MNALREAFRIQSRTCTELGSPFMARLLSLCAERLEPNGAAAKRMFDWPRDPSLFGDTVPLRFTGALHALKLRGDAALTAAYPPNEVSDDVLWDAVTNALKSRDLFIQRFLDTAPQTNEVRRGAVIAPVLSLLSAKTRLPIRLIELGCSGGLNLRADLFRVETGGVAFGPAASPVRLTPEWRGAPPPAPADPVVTDRIGVDLAPLDPDRDRTRLLAYLWPDQEDRLLRTRAAMDIARRIPARLVTADALDALRTVDLTEGRLTLIFHTIAWQYLPRKRREEGEALIAALGARATSNAPLAWFGMEADGPFAGLDLAFWPRGASVRLGTASYHGRWIEWNET